MSASQLEIELSAELVKWIKFPRYHVDLDTSVVYILEQTKRAEDDDQLTKQMEQEFPPETFYLNC